MSYEIKMTFLVKTFSAKKYEEMLEIVKNSLWENEQLRDVQLIDFICNEEKSDSLVMMHNMADTRLLNQMKAETLQHLKRIERLMKCNDKEKKEE